MERLQTDKWHQRALLNASQESFLENNLEKFTVTPEDKLYLLYVYTKLSFFVAKKDNTSRTKRDTASFKFILKLFLQVFLQVPLARSFLH